MDDGYSPPKTVEQARKLVGATRFCSSSIRWARAKLGDPEIHESKQVPQLFVATAHQVERSREFPWTMGWQPNTRANPGFNASIFSRTCRTPRSRSSIRTTINGKDYVKGLKDVSCQGRLDDPLPRKLRDHQPT